MKILLKKNPVVPEYPVKSGRILFKNPINAVPAGF